MSSECLIPFIDNTYKVNGSIKNLFFRENIGKNGSRTYRLTNGLETPLYGKKRALTQGIEKFFRAVDKAKIIGKGICKIELRGYQPLTLAPLYLKEITYSDKSATSVHLLSPFKRLSFAVDFCAGKLLRKGKAYDTTEGKKIDEPQIDAFVISPNEHLYAGAIQVGKFHHSSFLSAGAVIFAGELETDSQGKISKITNRSGHYKPQKKHLLQALHWFKKRGIDISAVELHEYDVSRPKDLFIYASAEHYLNSRGLCEPNQKIKL